MCSIGGPTNLTMDELTWYRHRCTKCGHVYKSMGKESICPRCGSEDVENV